MQPIQRILIPIDFSECSEHALELAANLAGKIGADAVAVHVIAPPTDYLPMARELWGAGAKDRLSEQAQAKAERDLEAFRQRQPEEVREAVRFKIEKGVPYDRILQDVEREHFDMIVVGSRGRNAADRILMGSVAERLVRHAPCPVLVVH
ncbi:MAG: universal stress protein [Myxococcota bacterium]